MAEYELPNGYVLTDEEIGRRARPWEDGSWGGGLVTIRAGRPRLSDEPNANLSFKCPESSAELIGRAARATGVKKSAFVRDAAIEKAAAVLAAVGLARPAPSTNLGKLIESKSSYWHSSIGAVMATALANAPVMGKVTEAEKSKFVATCEEIGTTPSNAIRMFVSAFNRRGGFPFDPSNPHGFSAETLQAMDDAVHHRTFGPFKTVDEMFAALDED